MASASPQAVPTLPPTWVVFCAIPSSIWTMFTELSAYPAAKIPWTMRKWRKYTKAARQLELRAAHYNKGVALAQKYAREGKALIIAPDDTCGVATLARDKTALKSLYDKGYRDGAAISEFM